MSNGNRPEDPDVSIYIGRSLYSYSPLPKAPEPQDYRNYEYFWKKAHNMMKEKLK